MRGPSTLLDLGCHFNDALRKRRGTAVSDDIPMDRWLEIIIFFVLYFEIEIMHFRVFNINELVIHVFVKIAIVIIIRLYFVLFS